MPVWTGLNAPVAPSCAGAKSFHQGVACKGLVVLTGGLVSGEGGEGIAEDAQRGVELFRGYDEGRRQTDNVLVRGFGLQQLEERPANDIKK